MTKVVNYISEAFEELKSNVTWPEWAEVQRLTIVVAVFSIVFALAGDSTITNVFRAFVAVLIYM